MTFWGGLKDNYNTIIYGVSKYDLNFFILREINKDNCTGFGQDNYIRCVNRFDHDWVEARSKYADNPALYE